MDKCPDQLKLPFALWTRKAVQQLVFELWSIKMPIRTVGEYLMRWKFTPQKPLKRAYEQNPKAVKRWLEEDYPEIAASAKAEKAEIHWGDETGLANNCQHGRSYSLRGKTPVLRLPAKKERINLISSVTNQGLARFMIYDGTMNSDTFIKFLKRLINSTMEAGFCPLNFYKLFFGDDISLGDTCGQAGLGRQIPCFKTQYL